MKWTKPNGTNIETNDMKATIAYCKSLGWKQDKQAGKRDGIILPPAGTGPIATNTPSKPVKEPVVKPESLPRKQVLRAGKI